MTRAPVKSIGAMLVESRRLTPEQAEGVLRYQRQHGLPFGEAAIRMGFVTQADVDFVIAQQFEYPYLLEGESAVDPLVVAAYQPFDARVEAIRAIRTQLLLRLDDANPRGRRIALVSAQKGDGRSVLAANLAVVFSQLGEKTLLIDADLRSPRQHELFGLENGVGLSSMLSGRATLDAIKRVPVLRDLSILPSGPRPPNPQELLGRHAFLEMLDDVSSRYDVVLLDTPPADLHADALTVANRAGSGLVIARRNFSRVAGVRDLAQWLNQARSMVLGSVLNEF